MVPSLPTVGNSKSNFASTKYIFAVDMNSKTKYKLFAYNYFLDIMSAPCIQ